MIKRLSFAMLLTLIGTVATPGTQRLIGRCLGVVDGDTLSVELGGVRYEVDLYGIDAPELEQPAGEEAAASLTRLACGDVTLEVQSRDGDRLVAKVFREDQDTARQMVEGGYAWLAEDGATDESYAVALFVARGARQGIWAEDDPEHPAAWRLKHLREPRKPTLISLSDLAGSIELEKNDDGKTVIDWTDVPSRVALMSEARLFAVRLVEIAETEAWIAGAQRVYEINCSVTDPAGADGSFWSEQLGTWVDGTKVPRGCDELGAQVSEARAWVRDAKRLTLEDAKRAGLSDGDLDAIARAVAHSS